MESDDINKTFRKSIEDSKKEISNALQPTEKNKKRKLSNRSNCKPKKSIF